MDDDTPPPGKPVVTHLLRVRLPWSTTDKTECGKDPEQFKRVCSRADAVRRWKEIGQGRAQYEFCMTCVQTANRHPEFKDQPVAATKRGSYWMTEAHDARAVAELRAVALVLDTHREEFEAAVEEILTAPSLDDFRQQKAKRRRLPHPSRGA